MDFPANPASKMECTVVAPIPDAVLSPAFKMKAGKEVEAHVTLKETVRGGGECTHVPGDVQLHSRLGLDLVDLNILTTYRKTDNEYRVLETVLKKSLFGNYNVPQLSKCSSNVDASCALPVQHTVVRDVANFGDRYFCDELANGAKRTGYSPITDPDACAVEWGKVLVQGVESKSVMYHRWNTLAWNSTENPSLSVVERQARAPPCPNFAYELGVL